MAEKIWSAFQLAIFAAVEAILATGRDLVVLARAGTGKTTTILEAVVRFCRAEPNAQVLLCAFNTKVARELESRLADAGLGWKQAEAKTLHGVGYAAIKRAKGKVKVEPRKGKDIAKRLALGWATGPDAHSRHQVDGLAAKVAKLADLAKGLLIDPEHAAGLIACATRFRVADQDDVEVVAHLAGRAMREAAADTTQVDFGDQIWLPYYLGLKPWPRTLVVVDEAQDMNPAQLWLARASVKRGGRLIAVGDDRQAIYGWRGADSEFLARMVDELGAATLTLPVTYRCGRAIVREAQEIVPDYVAGTAFDGVVRTAPLDLNKVSVGDFLLSRVNAPLLGLALKLLAHGTPATIQGRDIMQQLINLIGKSRTATTPELLAWVADYEVDETRKLTAADADDSVVEEHHDRCECIRALAPEHKLVTDLVASLERLFSDRDDSSVVTLSTVHRAKGLERDRVWMLVETFQRRSRDGVATWRPGDEEANIRYVAITRAKRELIYC